ncbi:transposase [Lichenibacterium minor]|uniref:Transposase n=1 Tax=Lichenibacterium minor TaxID=2316528 RepID=A0A4Q2U2P6_9HYPH|nr:transposase domain-containing protein [Lichenibacterium minor]RYC28956.1 transposase [Lichenibacterium minor]
MTSRRSGRRLCVWLSIRAVSIVDPHPHKAALAGRVRPSFARFLDDGRVCLSNNAAERALRGLALGRKAWLFAGSNRGGQRAAFFNSLIVTAKLNDVDPQVWLADVLGRIASHPAQRLAELLPWNWQPIPAASPSFDAAA